MIGTLTEHTRDTDSNKCQSQHIHKTDTIPTANAAATDYIFHEDATNPVSHRLDIRYQNTSNSSFIMVRIKRLVFWLSLIGSISVTMMNLVVLFSLPDAQFLATSSFGSTLRDQFLHPGFSFIHKQQLLKQLQIQQEQQFRPRRRSRTLIGYFSMESRGDCYYRKRHRELFQIWNDTRVCSLYSLQKDPMRYSECQLVYTFVMGGTMAAVGAVNTTTPGSTTTSAADDPPTMIVNNFPFPTRPLYHPHPPILKCSDKHAKDIIWLNIRYVAWPGFGWPVCG